MVGLNNNLRCQYSSWGFLIDCTGGIKASSSWEFSSTHFKSSTFEPTGNQKEGLGLSESSWNSGPEQKQAKNSDSSESYPGLLSHNPPSPPSYLYFSLAISHLIKCVWLFFSVRNHAWYHTIFIMIKCETFVHSCLGTTITSIHLQNLCIFTNRNSYQLNSNSSFPFPSAPAPGNQHSSVCLYEFDFSRYLV